MRPAHMVVIDIDEALAEAMHLLEPWWHVRKWPDSPPWSGGVYDAWPARDADVCAIARAEEQLIWELIAWKEQKHGRPNPPADR